VELAQAVAGGSGAHFELEYVDQAGKRQQGPLLGNWDAAFEAVNPVRGFRWAKGQRHFPGWWWSATTGSHVGFESWLERDHAMLLDFDHEVTGFASQPFWLKWAGQDRERRHAPDYFARLADGTGVVIDVRADDQIDEADAEVFTSTALACAEVGWRYRRVGVVDPVLAANIRWLSRYRHPRHGSRTQVSGALLEFFERPSPLFAGAQEIGDRLAVLPVLFHLLWCQRLAVDLTVGPLGPDSVARTSAEGMG
jgi:hypothetical protein